MGVNKESLKAQHLQTIYFLQKKKLTKKQDKINKMATISTSVRSAMKMTPAVASAVTSTGSKIVSRGSFFDKESQNAFLEKHQQKCTPKNSTWNSNSNSKSNNMGK